MFLFVTMASAQPEKPVVGQPVPDFQLTDVHHYNKKTISANDLKGKWTVLDFWSKGCTACVKSFPKLNELQHEFKDDIQFVLVGINNKSNKNIEQIYERFRQKFNLDLVVAYDSILSQQFEVTAVPLVVILDPSSNVYSITFSDFLQRDNIRNMINNISQRADREISQRGKLWEFWINDTVNNKRMIYRSILSQYAGEALTGSNVITDHDAASGTYQTVHLSLASLYLAAYDWLYHSNELNWEHPVLEVNDSSKFQFDTYSYEGLYNYSVTVPVDMRTKRQIMGFMQADLQKYFGYDVVIEKRKMPYWRLTASRAATKQLASTAREHYFNADPISVTGRKIQTENILSVIRQYNNQQPIPFIDETGITGNIDISFNAVMTNLEDVRKTLSKQGLLLEIAHKEMTVLVIRDPQTGSSGY